MPNRPHLPADETKPHTTGGYAILIVDDDAEMRAYIRHCLRTFAGGDHRISEASDGQEGLVLLEMEPFDVMITDVVMPRMDGLDLCRAARERYPTMPVLLVSGEVPAEARRQAQLQHAGAALAKPFNARKLRLTLDHLLDTS